MAQRNRKRSTRTILLVIVVLLVTLAVWIPTAIYIVVSDLSYNNGVNGANGLHGVSGPSFSLFSGSVAQEKHQVPYQYTPAPIEKYIMEHLTSLGYDTHGNETANTCDVVWNETSPIYNEVQQYLVELEQYNRLVRDFEPISELRLQRKEEDGNAPTAQTKNTICSKVKLHPNGLQGLFSTPLSQSTTVGYMEPLLPTMRNPHFCHNPWHYLMNMEYILHDFFTMCQHLTPHSRLVFIDMGASLSFHSHRIDPSQTPDIYLHSLYRKFGFQFDHIYAYEKTPQNATAVYELLPEEMMMAWHWMNVAVDPTPGGKLNPFRWIRDGWRVEDFVVVKLDVDCAWVEVPLLIQLLTDEDDSERGDVVDSNLFQDNQHDQHDWHNQYSQHDRPSLLDLVDQFYFEHHVHQKELADYWLGSMEGSVKESLEWMGELRRRGVAAHYWP